MFSFEGRELEGVNNLSSQILRRCFPTNKLPVSTLSSPLAFALLDLDSAGHSGVEDLLDDSGEGTVQSLFLEPYIFWNLQIFCSLSKNIRRNLTLILQTCDY